MNKLKYTDICNSYSAVIFDLDGTLVDSMWIWRDIDREYLARYGIEMPEDLQECIKGVSYYEIASYFMEKFNIPGPNERLMDEWNDMALAKYRDTIDVKPGVIRFLNELKESGIRIALATSNSRPLVDAVLKRHGIIDCFEYICTGDQVMKGKPQPDCYLTCADALNINPSECLVFEDLYEGVMAGKAAGMTVCAVYDDYGASDADKILQLADYTIDTMEELF